MAGMTFAEMIRKAAVESMARELMAEHELPVTGPGAWSFRWDRSKTREGQCIFGRRVISLSWPIAQLRELAESRDTILHEIAHAIAGYRAAHGPAWKAVCRKIGARPVACSDGQRAEMRYTGRCPAGHTAQRDRLDDRARAGLCCLKCSRAGRGRLRFTWTEN